MVRRRSFREFDSSAASLAEKLVKKQRQESDASISTVDSNMSGAVSPKSDCSADSSGSFESLFEVPSDVIRGAIFVGHINTDLDSVAGAIAGAYLYDGVAALSEDKELNGEIVYALGECGIEVPQVITDIENYQDKNVCLVDHTEQKQMPVYVRENMNKIVGVIDHHALASNFHTEKPIFMDIRPWGCMSTIVMHMYLRQGKAMPQGIAKLMMSAILSDTLNLKSPTTTKTDIYAVCLLSKYCGVELPAEARSSASSAVSSLPEEREIQEDAVTKYAKQMFQAKTEWVCGLGAEKMCRADFKEFEASGKKLGIAVLEIAGTPEPVVSLESDIRGELEAVRAEKDLDYQFLFVVDVVSQTSVMIPRSREEMCIAKKAFNLGECDDETMVSTISVGNYASRKKQFFPMIQTGLKAYLA